MTHRLRNLGTTTALATLLALSGPQLGFAQQHNQKPCPEGAEAGAENCIPPQGTDATAAPEGDAVQDNAAPADTAQDAPEQPAQDPAAPQAAETPEAPAAPAESTQPAETQPAETAHPETAPAEEPPAVAGDQPETAPAPEQPQEPAVAEEQPDAAPAPEQPPVAEGGHTAPTAESIAEDLKDKTPSSEEAQAAPAGTTAPAEEQPAAPEQTADQPQTDTPAQDTTEEQPAAEPAAPTAESIAEDLKDTAPAADAEAGTETDANVATETETAPEPETDQAAETPAESETADKPVVTGHRDQAESGEPVAAAAANPDAAEPAETTEVTVTEETSRSSDEDFEEPSASAESDDDDKGLSNFEKFALGAAGLVVLDQLIGNNDKVVENTGDRVVVQRDDGQYYVLKDDDVLLRRPGSDVRTETFRDGSTRTVVTRPNGVQVVTISAADGTMLRRTRILNDGTEYVLFDDTQTYQPVDVSQLPTYDYTRAPANVNVNDGQSLRAALEAQGWKEQDRRFSLSQVRNIAEVRALMPEINIDAINFETGSAAISPDEAEDLYALGEAMSEFIADNPDEIFLIEGHTDAVGGAASNLALSDRRAESVALALTEYFEVPPENMVVQGYGEQFLLVPTDSAERTNRRATVRRITPLVTASAR